MKINQMKALLELILTMETSPAVMLWGQPGIGKSQAIKQIAVAHGWGLVDLRLLLLSPIDLRGLPVPDKEHYIALWIPPSFLPRVEVHGETGILFLDEINAAPPAVQAAAYQLVLDHRCGEYILPPKWKIVAAGNNSTDRAVINRMPSPLANRLIHLEVEAELEDWKIWAYQNHIHQDVISFLNWKPGLLYKFPSEVQEVRAFPSPRTWEFVSSILHSFKQVESSYPAIVGAVGEGAAAELMAFIKIVDRLPNAELILSGNKVKVPKDPSVLYALSGGLVQRLKVEYTLDRVHNLFKFLNDIPIEFQVLTVKDCLKIGIDFQVGTGMAPPYIDWVSKHAVVLGVS